MNILLASGGYDSTVLAAHLEFQKINFIPYHCQIFKDGLYNTINNKEEYNCFIKNFIKYSTLYISTLHLRKRETSEEIDCYVPGRNTIFVYDAINRFYANHSSDTSLRIYIGIIETVPRFADCTQEWLNNLNKLLQAEFGDKVIVVAPFINFSKDQVYKLGQFYNVKLESTFSCNYVKDGEPCGKCGNCIWRKEKCASE